MVGLKRHHLFLLNVFKWALAEVHLLKETPRELVTRKPTTMQQYRNPWYNNTELCKGVFDPETRARDILRHKVMPEELTAVRVAVPGNAPDPLSQQNMCRHFLCFGFSSDNPFMMPGTQIHFHEEGHEKPVRKAEVSSMYVANGRRTGEKAVLISFCSPLPESDVSAIFHDTFSVTEIDSTEELCSSLQDLVKHYVDIAGDTEECMRGTEPMLENALKRWNNAMSRAEDAAESACRREDDRGMVEYFRALACVDGLRNRGVALNEDAGEPQVETGKKRKGDGVLGRQKRPRMGLTYASTEAHQRMSLISTGRSPCSDSLVVKRSGGKTLNIAKFTSVPLLNLAARLAKQRKDEIAHAHAKYMIGLLGCMCDNPVGIRQYLMMYEDFMRVEAGAEITYV
jgi:hypothetical protein